MSKKRTVITFLIAIAIVVLNIMIFCYYNTPMDNKEIDITISLKSDKEKEIELFYLYKHQNEIIDFNTEQVVMASYEKSNEDQTLTFSVPATVTDVRMDFGGERSETVISNMKIQYKGQSVKLSDTVLQNIQLTNDIESVKYGEGVVIKSSDRDPYLIWSTKDWNIEELVRGQDFLGDTILKIIGCLFIDVILLVLLKYSRALIKLIMELFQNRKLIFNLAKNDFKTKYAGSYLGIIWAFVQPIVTVLLYWFVFEKGLRAQGINTKAGIEVPFVLWLIAGLVPWFFFQDAVNGALSTLLEYNYLVKKVVFKVSILPIVKIMSAFFVHVFFVVFMLVLYNINGYFIGIAAIQIIYYSFCVFVLAVGIGYITSAVVPFFRDLTQIINIVLQVLMWMTPIMWNMDGMELSPVLETVFKLNPVYYIVNGYRSALISGAWFWEYPYQTMYFWGIATFVFAIGAFVFKKLQVHFADVL